MKRFWLGLAATAVLAACSGGNPFAENGDDGDVEIEVPDADIPASISRDLQGVTYNPTTETLTVRGISLDDTSFEAVYRRRPDLDQPGGYQAYTSQESSLSQHSTAYVKEIDGTRGAVVVTGGQFEHYFSGGVYGRDGAFDPPDVGSDGDLIVQYAGDYVGLLNLPGDGGDLLPVDPGTPASFQPRQAGEVTGRVLINADFNDNRVQGGVTDRVFVDSPGTPLADLAFEPSDISENGTFAGNVTINLQGRGEYGGIFGGPNSSAVAGSLFVSDHIDGVDNEEEHGLFVLPKCGTPGEDALCNQPNP